MSSSKSVQVEYSKDEISRNNSGYVAKEEPGLRACARLDIVNVLESEVEFVMRLSCEYE